ncbi:MAG: PadR family transcriptional regulator [Tepidiformaceae bacterium]
MLRNQPSVGEFAVLGILAQRSMHGYEMAHCFEHEDLCEVYPIEQSMLYTHVRKLEERGLISGAEERVGQRPPRKTYSLSETGTESLRNWLGEPVERMRQVRVEFLMKLYFLRAIDPAAERHLLRRQLEVCEAYYLRLSERVQNSTGFTRLVAMSKESAAEATLGWLRKYSNELDEPAVVARVGGRA